MTYATAYAKLKAKGFQLHWQSAPAGQQAKAKKASKTKSTSPECLDKAGCLKWTPLSRPFFAVNKLRSGGVWV